MEKEVVLNCSYNEFRGRFLEKIESDDLTFSNLCRNQKESLFIGHITKHDFWISYNKSFTSVTRLSYWTVSQLIAPTVMIGKIKSVDTPMQIELLFTKNKRVLFFGKAALVSAIVWLLISLVFIKHLESPFIGQLMVALYFSGIGIYLLHIPQEDRKRLVEFLLTLE